MKGRIVYLAVLILCLAFALDGVIAAKADTTTSYYICPSTFEIGTSVTCNIFLLDASGQPWTEAVVYNDFSLSVSGVSTYTSLYNLQAKLISGNQWNMTFKPTFFQNYTISVRYNSAYLKPQNLAATRFTMSATGTPSPTLIDYASIVAICPAKYDIVSLSFTCNITAFNYQGQPVIVNITKDFYYNFGSSSDLKVDSYTVDKDSGIVWATLKVYSIGPFSYSLYFDNGVEYGTSESFSTLPNILPIDMKKTQLSCPPTNYVTDWFACQVKLYDTSGALYPYKWSSEPRFDISPADNAAVSNGWFVWDDKASAYTWNFEMVYNQVYTVKVKESGYTYTISPVLDASKFDRMKTTYYCTPFSGLFTQCTFNTKNVYGNLIDIPDLVPLFAMFDAYNGDTKLSSGSLTIQPTRQSLGTYIAQYTAPAGATKAYCNAQWQIKKPYVWAGVTLFYGYITEAGLVLPTSAPTASPRPTVAPTIRPTTSGSPSVSTTTGSGSGSGTGPTVAPTVTPTVAPNTATVAVRFALYGIYTSFNGPSFQSEIRGLLGVDPSYVSVTMANDNNILEGAAGSFYANVKITQGTVATAVQAAANANNYLVNNGVTLQGVAANVDFVGTKCFDKSTLSAATPSVALSSIMWLVVFMVMLSLL